MVGDVTSFTGGVTDKTNPVPKPPSSAIRRWRWWLAVAVVCLRLRLRRLRLCLRRRWTVMPANNWSFTRMSLTLAYSFVRGSQLLGRIHPETG